MFKQILLPVAGLGKMFDTLLKIFQPVLCLNVITSFPNLCCREASVSLSRRNILRIILFSSGGLVDYSAIPMAVFVQDFACN